MPAQMRALRLTGPERYELALIRPPAAVDSDVLVAPAFVGLCGTDLELFRGTMPYFRTGDTSYPLQIGHEFSATVATSSNGFRAGDLVIIDPVVGCGACDSCSQQRQTWCLDRSEIGVRGRPGGAAELVAVPASNLHRVPQGLSLDAAALAEPAVTALAGIGRLRSSGGDALVLGAGTIGLIAAQVLLSRGWTVRLGCASSEDRARAADLGVQAIDTTSGLAATAADVVVEAAGTDVAVRAAVSACRPGGEIVLLGVPGDEVDQFDVASIVLRDLTIYGVLNGPGRYEEALQLLSDGTIDSRVLIDCVVPLAESGEALRRLAMARRRPKVLLQIAGRS